MKVYLGCGVEVQCGFYTCLAGLRQTVEHQYGDIVPHGSHVERLILMQLRSITILYLCVTLLILKSKKLLFHLLLA